MGSCERLLRVEAPADRVWEWISQPKNIFGVNIFHAVVDTEETELRPGATIDIDHDFFGFAKQARQAKIREVRKNFLAFGEYKKPEAPGRDPFPHNQSFEVIPVDESSCIVSNKLTGRYIFPGSGVMGEPLFNRYIPVILDDDNQMIAIGCGAMEPSKLYIPKGLLLWPLMVGSARLVKKSTRREMLEQMKARHRARVANATASSGAATTTEDDGDGANEDVKETEAATA